MIVSSAADFQTAFRALGRAPVSPPLPGGVFLMAPNQFSVSPATAGDNRYMDLDSSVDPQRAAAQHDALARLIRSLGLEVKIFEGAPDQPDGVFLNNAFATAPGWLIIGRMATPERQRETAHADIREFFTSAKKYQLIDLSELPIVAELTGVMVLDRGRRIGYCGMTDRVDEAGCAAMDTAFTNRLTFRFDLEPGEYHTNVVLSVLAGRACVMVPDAFADEDVPGAIASVYPDRTLLLSDAEKRAFAGNCIALTENDLLLSQTALRGMTGSHRKTLERWGFTLHAVELDEFEKAGGSLRCLVAELF